MAADVVLRAPDPGGASPEPKGVGQGAGLVTEASGREGGKSPSTAVRRPGRLGLNTAGGRDGPARRGLRATGARAATCCAVRPSILSPTSRKHLDRYGAGREFLGAAETLRRVVRHLPDRERHPSPPGGSRRTRREAAPVFSKELGRVRGPRRRPAGPDRGRYHYRPRRGFGKGRAWDDVTASSRAASGGPPVPSAASS